ncbi:MAG: GntR family transcriptional regulator [Rhodobacterales bacterium]|nr:GntR family transcriptional regulator [Rhodobacterales bacterium]
MPENAKSPKQSTVTERIERQLACEILRGDRVPGSRMPSIRALAVAFEVTLPTIQRAMDRLGRTGLVTARRGSGTTVNDPRRNMDLSLIPLWFEALKDQPERCAKILADFLQLRRVLTAHLFDTSSAKLLAALPKLSITAATLMAATDIDDIARADAKLTRIVVERVDNFALNAFFYTVEHLAIGVPHIAEALYRDRSAHRAVIAQVMTSFAMPDRVKAAVDLQNAFQTWDALTVDTYEALLT